MAAPVPQDSAAAYATVQRKADAEIMRALREATKEVNARLRTLSGTQKAELERSRLLAIKKSILDAQAEIFEKTGKIIERRRAEAAARAIQVSGRYDEIAFAAVGREQDARALAAGLEATEARAIDTLVARVTGSRVPLSQRVYRTQAWANGQLERRINSALARGLNADQMAAELRNFVNPNTPGGTRYAAMRLARTEISNAYHAMAIRSAQLKPWVTKVEWHTSRSHARKDECDALNGQLFAPEDCPPKPHPQCMCYITPVVDDDDEAFLDALAGGDYDEFLDQFAERQGIDLSAQPAAVEQVAVATSAATVPPRVRHPGRNMTDEVVAEFRSATDPDSPILARDNRWTLAEARGMNRPTDTVLTEIGRAQGWGLPEVLDSDEMDLRRNQGWTEMFRGAQNSLRTNTRATEQMDQLRNDPDFELGTGIYGNGMYLSEDSRVADQFAGRVPGVKPIGGGKGVAVRVLIDPDARLIDYDELVALHKEWLFSLPRDQFALANMFYDRGRWAAIQGYDGIIVANRPDGATVEGQESRAMQIVIFNREVIAVERTNR